MRPAAAVAAILLTTTPTLANDGLFECHATAWYIPVNDELRKQPDGVLGVSDGNFIVDGATGAVRFGNKAPQLWQIRQTPPTEIALVDPRGLGFIHLTINGYEAKAVMFSDSVYLGKCEKL